MGFQLQQVEQQIQYAYQCRSCVFAKGTEVKRSGAVKPGGCSSTSVSALNNLRVGCGAGMALRGFQLKKVGTCSVKYDFWCAKPGPKVVKVVQEDGELAPIPAVKARGGYQPWEECHPDYYLYMAGNVTGPAVLDLGAKYLNEWEAKGSARFNVGKADEDTEGYRGFRVITQAMRGIASATKLDEERGKKIFFAAQEVLRKRLRLEAAAALATKLEEEGVKIGERSKQLSKLAEEEAKKKKADEKACRAKLSCGAGTLVVDTCVCECDEARTGMTGKRCDIPSRTCLNNAKLKLERGKAVCACPVDSLGKPIATGFSCEHCTCCLYLVRVPWPFQPVHVASLFLPQPRSLQRVLHPFPLPRPLF